MYITTPGLLLERHNHAKILTRRDALDLCTQNTAAENYPLYGRCIYLPLSTQENIPAVLARQYL